MKLLIIADDLTGALDTGIQFSSLGIDTKVVISRKWKEVTPTPDVLVIDSQSRHLPPKEAYEVVARITEAATKYGVPYILKKTDSALRGNTGSELGAVLDAGNSDALTFLPSFPKMNRVTKQGIHYIDHVPVAESVFGKDPFTPVTESSVVEIIKQQYDGQVTSVSLENLPTEGGIHVFDATTYEEMTEIAQLMKEKGKLKLMAGCAGLGTILPDILELERKEVKSYDQSNGLLVVSGSVNPITQSQLTFAEKNGFKRIRLSYEQKLNSTYWETEAGQEALEELHQSLTSTPHVIIDSNDIPGETKTMDYAKEKYDLCVEGARKAISANIGTMLKHLVDKGMHHSLMVTGGDTLLGFVKELDVEHLDMVAELEPGTVLSEFAYGGRNYHLISKSGGFGEEEILLSLKAKLTS